MTQTKPTRIVIPREGIGTGSQAVRAVYDQLSSKIIGQLGQVETVRASHVEPGSQLSQAALAVLGYEFASIGDGNKWQILPDFSSHWFADMTPTGNEVVLGPYTPGERDKALDEEVEWLHAHNIPTCDTCTEKQHAKQPVPQPKETESPRSKAAFQAMMRQYAGRDILDYTEWEINGNSYKCFLTISPREDSDTPDKPIRVCVYAVFQHARNDNPQIIVDASESEF